MTCLCTLASDILVHDLLVHPVRPGLIHVKIHVLLVHPCFVFDPCHIAQSSARLWLKYCFLPCLLPSTCVSAPLTMKRTAEGAPLDGADRGQKAAPALFPCPLCGASHTGSHQWKRYVEDGVDKYCCRDCYENWLAASRQAKHAAAGGSGGGSSSGGSAPMDLS